MERRPRSPGVAFAALTLVLLAVLTILSLSARTPPPPTIAEFAPQSVENITDAPTDQSSSVGRGAGECRAGGVCGGTGIETPSPIPISDPIVVPRVRKCVGDPPRQIEDPQSPPCVPYWAGDNGGATSKGVTRDEVRIAIQPENGNMWPALQAFFNKRFEFYGRQLNLIPNLTEGDSPAGQQAAAVAADQELNAFASVGRSTGGGFDFHRELARRKIVSSTYFPNFTHDELVAQSPYLWQYPMAVDRMMVNTAEWICGRLAGRLASHAGRSGVEDLSTKTRKIGLVLQLNSGDSGVSAEPFERALSSCGHKVAVKRVESNRDNTFSPNYGQSEILAMKTEGITTIVCFCLLSAVSGAMAGLGNAATAQDYYPEWLSTTYFLLDATFNMQVSALPAEQRERLMGLTFKPRQWLANDQPWRWAMKEGDPGCEYCGGSAGAGNYGGNNVWGYWHYQDLLLLASGIQMAGPRLTPESFRSGLQRSAFPNPDHPLFTGKVGFAGGSHSMTLDAAEMWWSNTARSAYEDETGGAWCYVDGGIRHAAGKWPRGGDPFFAGTCDSGVS